MFKRSILILLLLSLAACKPPQDKTSANLNSSSSSLKAQIELAENPKLGPSVISVYVLDNNQALSGAKVEVTGDMSHAGMVPVISEALETEAGLYQTKDFEFTMAGDWILSVVVKTADGKKLNLEKKLSVAGN